MIVDSLPYVQLVQGKTDLESEIRVLRLHAGRKRDKLTASVVHAKFGHAPSYTALSYVWGQQKQSREAIRIAYGSEIYELTVGESLGAALYHLRNEKQTVLLWVDALCIDQRDAEPSSNERGWQVKLMGNLYRRSVKTIVWLGPGSALTNVGMDAMLKLSAVLERLLVKSDVCWVENLELFLTSRWLTAVLPSSSKNTVGLLDQLTAVNASPFKADITTKDFENIFALITGARPGKSFWRHSPDVIKGIKEMCARPWWSRVWILQEYCLSPVVAFRTGEREIQDKDFCRGVQVCNAVLAFVAATESKSAYLVARLNPGRDAAVEEQAKDIMQMRHRKFNKDSHGTFDRLQLINYPGRKRGKRGATQNADRIFAALGMLDDTLDTVPNYNIPTEDTYRIFTERLLAKGDLHILSRVRPAQNELKVPSWCVDWTSLQPDTAYRTSAHHHVQPFPKVSLSFSDIMLDPGDTAPRRALNVQGRILGVIGSKAATFAEAERHVYAHDACPGPMHADACIWLMDTYLAFIKRAKPGQSVMYDMTRLFLPDALTRHLHGGDAAEVVPPHVGTSCESVARSCACLANETPGGFLARLAETAASQRIFATDTGLFGYAVGEAEKGDRVAQVGPYEYQVVLREVRPGRHEIVGGAHFPQSVNRDRVPVDAAERLTTLCIV